MKKNNFLGFHFFLHTKKEMANPDTSMLLSEFTKLFWEQIVQNQDISSKIIFDTCGTIHVGDPPLPIMGVKHCIGLEIDLSSEPYYTIQIFKIKHIIDAIKTANFSFISTPTFTSKPITDTNIIYIRCEFNVFNI
jgi:hypothetical protein